MSPDAVGRPAPTRSPDPRPVRTRARALEAARSLLLAKGWDAVTHVAVAERSGIGRTTLYRVWPDPVDLILEVLESELPSSEVAPTGDLRADLLAELGRLADRVNDPRTARLILTVMERAASTPDFARLRTAWHAQGTSGVRAALRAGVESGLLSTQLDEQEAVDQLAGPLVLRALFAAEPVTPAYLARNVDRFIATFR